MRLAFVLFLFLAVVCTAGLARKAGVAGQRNDELSEFPSSRRKGPQEMTIKFCSS